MTARDDMRPKCIETMVDAIGSGHYSRNQRVALLTIAFDALHGIARVVPPVAAQEMTLSVPAGYRWRLDCSIIFFAMSAAEDLTNPSSEKP